MMNYTYPSVIKNLIESFKKLPGIGEKTAERLAFSIIEEFKETDIDLFVDAINDTKTKLKKCSICNNLSEEEICVICKDKGRDKNILCVVEDTKNLILFEKIGMFKGRYHVLDGLISPMNGINPKDKNVVGLNKREKI